MQPHNPILSKPSCWWDVRPTRESSGIQEELCERHKAISAIDRVDKIPGVEPRSPIGEAFYKVPLRRPLRPPTLP